MKKTAIEPTDNGRRTIGQPFGLTDRERKFCEGYLRHGNQTKAAIDAGYTKADKKAYALVRKPKIAAFLKRVLEERWKAEIMGVDEIQSRLAWLARGDPGKLQNEDGSYKKFSELDEATRFCIRQWEDEMRFDADGAPPTMTRKVKMADPHAPLRTLAQINQLLAPDVHQLNVFIDLDARADAARKRVADHKAAQAKAEEAKVVSNQ